MPYKVFPFLLAAIIIFPYACSESASCFDLSLSLPSFDSRPCRLINLIKRWYFNLLRLRSCSHCCVCEPVTYEWCVRTTTAIVLAHTPQRCLYSFFSLPCALLICCHLILWIIDAYSVCVCVYCVCVMCMCVFVCMLRQLGRGPYLYWIEGTTIHTIDIYI